MRGFRIIPVVLLVFVSVAPASQVFLEQISLDRLVRSSDMILVVRPLAPFYTAESIKVPGENKREHSRSIPDFTTAACNLEVLRVIRNRLDKNVEGARIAVYPANTGDNLYLHTRYYAEGISKSPLFEKYDSPIEATMLEKEKEFVAFVTWSWKRDDGRTDFEFTAAGSYDRTDVIPAVDEILKKNK